jgi:hypothetical protein
MGMPRKSFDGLTRRFAALVFVIGATSLSSAAEITYDVSQPLGPASVTGDIVTDGKIGDLLVCRSRLAVGFRHQGCAADILA